MSLVGSSVTRCLLRERGLQLGFCPHSSLAALLFFLVHRQPHVTDVTSSSVLRPEIAQNQNQGTKQDGPPGHMAISETLGPGAPISDGHWPVPVGPKPNGQ